MPDFDLPAWLARTVPGRRFADIGALWSPQNELLSSALACGATQATAVDVTPIVHEGWRALERHLAERGTRRDQVRFKSADLLNTYFPEQVGSFDVVACRGVLYHLPDPVAAMLNLRRITRQHGHLASMVVPERIETAAGTLDLSETGALFAPAATPRARAVLAAHFASLDIDFATLQPDSETGWVSDQDIDFSCWWWFLTPRFLERLARLAGFRIVESALEWGGRMHSLALEVAS